MFIKIPYRRTSQNIFYKDSNNIGLNAIQLGIIGYSIVMIRVIGEGYSVSLFSTNRFDLCEPTLWLTHILTPDWVFVMTLKHSCTSPDLILSRLCHWGSSWKYRNIKANCFKTTSHWILHKMHYTKANCLQATSLWILLKLNKYTKSSSVTAGRLWPKKYT